MELLKATLIFFIGGFIYGMVEILYGGSTHWTMVIVGGICFLFIYNIHVKTTFHLLVKCFFGAVVITTIEFLTGLLVNVVLGWNVWDYSDVGYNLLGQICPQFTLYWFFLCIPAMYLAGALNENLLTGDTGRDDVLPSVLATPSTSPSPQPQR